MKNIHIINNTNTANSSGQLMQALSNALANNANCRLTHLNVPDGKWRKLLHLLHPRIAFWKPTLQCDTLVVHTTVIFSFSHILLAKISRKKIIVFLWDAYPGSFIGSTTGRKRFLHKVYACLEHSLLRMASLVLIPSEDYRSHTRAIGLHAVSIFPLWPFSKIEPALTLRNTPASLHIGFAGAINPIRGLPGAIQTLAAAYPGKIILHIYASKPVDLAKHQTPDNVEIIEHGFIEQSKLVTEMHRLDAGLVCLSDKFTQPAFPSKIISYVSSGIPVLYVGPHRAGIQSFLKTYNVGLCLSSSAKDDLAENLLAIKSNFAQSQQNALAHLSLTKDKLDKIL